VLCPPPLGRLNGWGPLGGRLTSCIRQACDDVTEKSKRAPPPLPLTLQTLPFTPGKRLAVLGPHVTSTKSLFEDYRGKRW
jgi:hypothetical protein